MGEKGQGQSPQVQGLLDSLFADSPVGIYIAQGGKLQFVNRSLLEFTGYTKDELLGAHDLTLVHPDDRYLVKRNAVKMLKGKRSSPLEFRVLGKSNETLWVLQTVSFIQYQGRRAVLGHALDVTRRKLAEEALRESQQKYRYLFDSLRDAAFLADAETGRIIETNKQAALLLGRSQDEIVGMHQSELHPEEAERSRQVFADHVQRTQVTDFHGEVINKEGLIIPVSVSASVLTLGGRQMALGLFRDISERKRMEEALRESEALFRTVAKTASSAIVIYQADRFRYANPAAQVISGYTQEELLAMNFWDLVDGSSQETAMRQGRDRLRGEPAPARYEVKIITKSGEEKWLDFAVSVTTFQGKPAGLAVALDITERKEMEEELRVAAQQWHVTFDAMNAPIFLCDVDGRILRCNRAMRALLGRGFDDIIGHHCWELVHGSQEPVEGCPLMRMRQSRRRETMTLTISDRYFEVSVDPIADDNGELTAAVHIMRDVTESRQAEEMIRRLAYRDHLTGLPNRSLFNDRLGMALAAAQRNQQALAVMFLDLDRFKDVNDSLGHSAGDRLLQQVGQRLQGLLRKSDTVARLGGDEFMFLLSTVPSGGYAIKVAQRILEALRMPITVDDHSLTVTASIGVALYPSDGEDAETLMRNADTAMYRAKERGRDNCEYYNPEPIT